MNNDIFCPRCKEFIGKQGNLEVCPLCGYDLTEDVDDNEE